VPSIQSGNVCEILRVAAALFVADQFDFLYHLDFETIGKFIYMRDLLAT